jgi:hypothetical protein
MQDTSEIKPLNGIRITDVVDVLTRPALMSSQYRRARQHRSAWIAALRFDVLPILMEQIASWIYMRLPWHAPPGTRHFPS